jgi:hypothetical protein
VGVGSKFVWGAGKFGEQKRQGSMNFLGASKFREQAVLGSK